MKVWCLIGLMLFSVALAARGDIDEEIRIRLEGVDPRTIKSVPREHPRVRNSQVDCLKTVNRLKNGPADIPDVLSKGDKYTDSTFWEDDMICQQNGGKWQNQQWCENTFGNISSGIKFYRRINDVMSGLSLFPSDGNPQFDNAIQGTAGTCYIMSAMSSCAERPDLIKNVFLNSQTNSAGIYGFDFCIRGKKWTIDIDDNMLYYYPIQPQLVFASTDKERTVVWPALLEKAFAKVKGSYDMSDGGFVETGLRTLLCAPVESYRSATDITNTAEADAMWQYLKDAEDSGYILGAGTVGTSSNQYNNECGIT